MNKQPEQNCLMLPNQNAKYQITKVIWRKNYIYRRSTVPLIQHGEKN